MNWVNLLFQFDEPTSRLYHLNLMASLALVFYYYWIHRNSILIGTFIKKALLNKKYWWNVSSRQDYFLYFLNGLLKIFFLGPILQFTFWIAQHTTLILEILFPQFNGIQESSLLIAAATLMAFLWDDFLRFSFHLVMHKSKFLWELHKVHHSARVLNPITLFRSHPIESAISVLRNSLSLGISSGLFVFAFNTPLNLWTILGVNAFGFVFNFFGANLRHSQIPLGFGKFETIFISPLQHQIHHSRSPDFYDKNFGVSLAIWDWTLGTLVYSKNVNNLRFGVSESFRSSYAKLLADPVVKIFKNNI